MHPVKTIVSYPQIIPHHQTNTEFLERPWILPSGQPLIVHIMYKNRYEGISFVPGRFQVSCWRSRTNFLLSCAQVSPKKRQDEPWGDLGVTTGGFASGFPPQKQVEQSVEHIGKSRNNKESFISMNLSEYKGRIAVAQCKFKQLLRHLLAKINT